MKLLFPLFVVVLGCSGVGSTSSPTEPTPTVDEARNLLEKGEVDDALLATDAILAANPDDVGALIVAGRGNLALVASGRDGGAFFLADAIKHFERAEDLDEDNVDALLGLADAYLKDSRFEEGAEAGMQAFALLTAGNAPAPRKADALLAVAANEMQLLVDAVREYGIEEQATKDAATRVLATYENARLQGATVPAAHGAANAFLWMDRAGEALETLERALQSEPSSDELHVAFQKIYFDREQTLECVGAYKRMLKTHGERPALLWYLGRVHATVADGHRRKGDWRRATAAYEDAHEAFARFGELERSKAAWSDQWRAICELALGRIAFEQNDLDAAARHYEAAFAASPAVVETDAAGEPRLFAWPGCDYPRNLSLLGRAIAESENGLERALGYWESIIERHPGQYFFAYNNAALTARDLGEVLAKAEADEATKRDNMARALALWEKSYGWYEKAVELAPDDARTANDCGLMLVYYLHRDYDRARELFERAIALGQPKVDELGDEAPESERQFREEAVGDAYQNIGVMLAQLNRPAGEIRPFHEKAIEYYPYQRREAVEYLRRLDSAKTQDPARDPRKPQFDAKIKEAVAHAEAGDWDAALLVLDGMAAEMRGYAPFHYHFGLYSLRYAQAAEREGGDAGLVSGLYADAVQQLARAVQIAPDDIESRLRLGEACLATAEWDKALDAVDDAFTRLQNTPGAAPEQLLAVHAVRAVAAARAYMAKKQDGADDEDALRAARASFAALAERRALTAAERSAWVNAERWAGTPGRAIDVLASAVEKSPDDQTLLTELVDVGWQVGETARAAEALATRDDALGLWFAGKARYLHGNSLWSGGDMPGALAELQKGIAAFENSKRTEPAYAASSDQWIAMCLGTMGLVEISREDWQAAQEHLLAALRRNPASLTADLGGSSIKRGILVVGDKYFRSRDLGKTADLYVAVGELAPDDVDLANNEGLFCRDHGTALERSGEREAAEKYYEASYAAYTRASRLDPTSVRLRNDRALLLIYHLGRDLEEARRLLEEAVADGERLLEESPPDDATELRDLQEAIGDCWENLGYSHMRQSGNLPAARAALEKSLAYYPFQRRVSRRHLTELERLEREQKDK